MTLRPAGAGDVAWVAALEAELFGPDAWSEEQVRAELAGEHRRCWVAEAIGYVVTMQLGADADVVDLHRIAVRPGHRRHGVARELLATAVQGADPANRMLLEVGADNTAALAFYAAEGFTEIARRPGYYRDGSDAVVMEKRLS